MANWSDPTGPAAAFPQNAGTASQATDAGLRSYMLSVYNYMAFGVLLSGVVAFLFAQGGVNSPAASIIMGGGVLSWVIKLAPLAFILVLSFGINRLSTAATQALFWAFAVAMGLSLSTIFLRFNVESISMAFFSTSVAFLGLSLFGYTTKRNLSGFGTFLLMGLIGIIVVMVLNALFFHSSGLALAVNIIGVLVFAGLTAYDTQMIKNTYYQVVGTDFMGKAVIMGALNLYLDFVNMFTMLLSIFGNND